MNQTVAWSSEYRLMWAVVWWQCQLHGFPFVPISASTILIVVKTRLRLFCKAWGVVVDDLRNRGVFDDGPEFEEDGCCWSISLFTINLGLSDQRIHSNWNLHHYLQTRFDSHDSLLAGKSLSQSERVIRIIFTFYE